jgi:3-deoxy-D-manno-octulosonic-acid transferase
MGEFEQAKPIISELKRRNPEVRVIASFFSPSGYDHSKNYTLADVITYIPFDTRENVRTFLDLVRPDVAVMVRYDVWPNMIWELHDRAIPCFIANATMRPSSARLLPVVRNFHKHLYDSITGILTVSSRDAEMFTRFGIPDVGIEPIGDTRYDQVTIRSAEARKRRLLPEQVTAGKRIFVAGSTWPEDEEALIPAYLRLRAQRSDVVLVIVPHEPTMEHIEHLERRLNGSAASIRFSAMNEYRGEPVIIVDSIGILLMLYATARIAYIGGSFRQGIHNVLEAAVYGIPVIFGPKHRNSQEPRQLVECGGAFSVNDTETLYAILFRLLTDETARADSGVRAATFVAGHTGATGKVLARIEPYLEKAGNT